MKGFGDAMKMKRTYVTFCTRLAEPLLLGISYSSDGVTEVSLSLTVPQPPHLICKIRAQNHHPSQINIGPQQAMLKDLCYQIIK